MNDKWRNTLKGDPLPWLMEIDPENPGVRYFTLKFIDELKDEARELIAAQQNIMETGPVPKILEAQDEQGFWVEPGPGYYPKYTGSVWQIISLAKLGADDKDARVIKGCQYLLENALSKYGGFSMNSKPTGLIHCLQGNLCAAFIDLGWLENEQVKNALDWLARSITGAGIDPSENRSASERYYRSGNSGPGFLCSANDHLPCAWGAVKALTALSKVPDSHRTDNIKRALDAGVDFLLSRNPAVADYPMGYSDKPNRSWFKFGFQIGYVTDILEIIETFNNLGMGNDPGLKDAIHLLLSKQDEQGRWKMEYTYNGKTWAEIERKNDPSKWVTLRAMNALKQIYT